MPKFNEDFKIIKVEDKMCYYSFKTKDYEICVEPRLFLVFAVAKYDLNQILLEPKITNLESIDDIQDAINNFTKNQK